MNSLINKVEEGLYIGRQKGRSEIANHNINVVVSVMTARERRANSPLPGAVEEILVDLVDDVSVGQDHVNGRLDYSTRRIKEARAAGKIVLVHCVAGISRSATVVLDYLMERDGTPFATALAQLEKVRPCVCPNDTFETVLRARSSDRLAPSEDE